MDQPLASGRAFLGLIRYVKDRHGQEKLQQVIDRCQPRTRQIFSQRIKQLNWNPYPAFIDFLEMIESQLGQGVPDYTRKLGQVSGIRDIGSMFRIYRAIASPKRLIRDCSNIWPIYYKNAGRMEATRWEPEDTVVRIYDFGQMHPTHCRLMEGWMIATMANVSIQVLNARESQCTSRGDPYHEFSCNWRLMTREEQRKFQEELKAIET